MSKISVMDFKLHIEKRLFFYIFLLAAVLRLWYAVNLPLPILEEDAIGRLAMANEWWYNLFHGIRDGQLVWLPLHLWIIDLPALFGADPENGGRWMTVLLSLLTFPLLYLLVKRRFGQAIALTACFLLAINPFHIKYSFITMSEVPYIFFVFAALYTLYLFIETDKRAFILLSSLCINCCNLIRFEGWMLAALFPLFLLYYRKSIGSFFLYGLLNSVSIAVYVLISYSLTHHLVHGLVMSNMHVAHWYKNVPDITGYIILNLSSDMVYPFWMILFLIAGIVMGIKRKLELPLLATATFLVVLIAYRILSHTNQPFWRYFAPGLFMLLPFAALSWYELSKKHRLIGIALFSFTTSYFGAQIYRQYNELKSNSYLTDGFYDAAAWMKANRKPGEKFVCSLQEGDYPAFGLLSGAKVNDMVYTNSSRKYIAITDTVFLRLIRIPGYKYAVYKNGTELDSILGEGWVQTELKLRGPQLKQVYHNQNYNIYTRE